MFWAPYDPSGLPENGPAQPCIGFGAGGILCGMAQSSRERSPLSAAIAATVRAERAAQGWTQQELARQSGVSYGSVRRIEDGSRAADIAQADRLARAFGVTLTELLHMAEQRLQREDGEGSPFV